MIADIALPRSISRMKIFPTTVAEQLIGRPGNQSNQPRIKRSDFSKTAEMPASTEIFRAPQRVMRNTGEGARRIDSHKDDCNLNTKHKNLTISFQQQFHIAIQTTDNKKHCALNKLFCPRPSTIMFVIILIFFFFKIKKKIHLKQAKYEIIIRRK